MRMRSLPEHLFVYGTLLSGTDGRLGMSERARLRSEAKLIGAAIMPGRLICLGDYPGLLDTAADDRVHGEVYEIDDRFGIFRWLDPYEDFEPERPDEGPYRRVQRSAQLAGGGELTCWVYVLRTAPANAVMISSGRWL
jgi:gamma-glutamylcyclotransferase (GGCT)/AIG2-like uncharacterized protein YtfP